WSLASSSFCFRGMGGGVALWRASRPEYCRIRALPGVLGLGAFRGRFFLGSIHCHGTICAPPLARHAGLVEPLAGGRVSGSAGGTQCSCRLSLGGFCNRSCKTGMVCSLLARRSSDTADVRSRVAVLGLAYNNC